MHDTSREHWQEVGVLRRVLAKKGVAISIPDAHVARCAVELKATLLSSDRVFAKVAKHCGVTLASH